MRWQSKHGNRSANEKGWPASLPVRDQENTAPKKEEMDKEAEYTEVQDSESFLCQGSEAPRKSLGDARPLEKRYENATR